MTVGLLGVGCIVLWERLVFTGPFNFFHHYRVSGTFSATSTAGAQIESYLSAAAPFAMLVALKARSAMFRMLAVAALALLLYAVLSTASRTAYAGVGLSVGLTLLSWLWLIKDTRRKIMLAAVVVALAGTIVTFAAGTYVGQRMSEVENDFGQRESHWALVRSLMDTDATTRWIGMGVGQYPPTFLWRAPAERRPATFSFARELDSTFIRLGAGRAVYVEQFVPVVQGERYIVRGKLRAPAGVSAVLTIALCDKWILYGLACAGATVNAQSNGAWETFERPLNAERLGRGPMFLARPVKFAMYNAGTTAIDVTDLVVEDSLGRNIVANGNFASGGDRWYFSADDHFPWNIFNLFLEVYFEQGWIGLALFAVLLGAVSVCLAIRAVRGNLAAAAFLASIVGYMVPAMFDSVIDDPRMRWLLLLLFFGSVVITGPVMSRTGSARSPGRTGRDDGASGLRNVPGNSQGLKSFLPKSGNNCPQKSLDVTPSARGAASIRACVQHLV
jgi:hypothetical protein